MRTLFTSSKLTLERPSPGRSSQVWSSTCLSSKVSERNARSLAQFLPSGDVGSAHTTAPGPLPCLPTLAVQGATLITVCNLKPASMRGVKSFAMVLCATSPDGKDGGVEFVLPPAGSQPGDRVYFEGFEDKTALELLNPKRKIFETVQPGESCRARPPERGVAHRCRCQR